MPRMRVDFAVGVSVGVELEVLVGAGTPSEEREGRRCMSLGEHAVASADRRNVMVNHQFMRAICLRVQPLPVM